MSDQCIHCGASDRERTILRCPICFKGYCEDHQHNLSGRSFCSAKCAEYFFFADPDDTDDMEE